MKIAIFTDCYLDLSGGIVTVINAEKQALEKDGHTVYVFSSAYPRSREDRKKLAKSQIFTVPSCKIIGRGIAPIARRPKIVEEYLLKNFPELKQFDIFYIHYEAGCSIAGIRLGQKLKIPTVQVMHGREDVGESLIIPKGLRTIVAVMLNAFHSWYLPHPIKIHKDTYLATTVAKAKMWELMANHANSADLVITPSDFFRQMLTHYGAKKPTKYLHHAINDEKVKEKIAPKTWQRGEPLEIIWHSRLAPEKRIMPFLEALKSVKSAYHFSAYGEGIDAKKAQKYAKKHHINATFYGVQPLSNIEKALKNAHLDVLVSYNYDTFGMSLIEAEATGTPVLIADPNLAEIVPQGGFLTTKDPSPAAIAAAIDSLTPTKIREMSKIMLQNRDSIKQTTKIKELQSIFSGIIKS